MGLFQTILICIVCVVVFFLVIASNVVVIHNKFVKISMDLLRAIIILLDFGIMSGAIEYMV